MANGWFTDSEVTRLYVYSKFEFVLYVADISQTCGRLPSCCPSLLIALRDEPHKVSLSARNCEITTGMITVRLMQNEAYENLSETMY
jgi:hypothetical protein